MVSFMSYTPCSKAGVTVKTLKGSSLLTVSSVTRRDEGNYSCVASNTTPASVSVHVVQSKMGGVMGDEMEAWMMAANRRHLWTLTIHFGPLLTVYCFSDNCCPSIAVCLLNICFLDRL